MKFEKFFVYAFFLILLCVGLSTYRNYGLSNDELSCHDLGTFNYYYITEHNNTLLRYSDKDYPPVFETFIIVIEKALQLEQGPTSEMFYLRHFLVFLTFYAGVFFFYLLCKAAFNSRMIGLLAAVALVLCPRIYGHAFFNSKDIPFMTFMIMSAYSAVEFLKSPSILRGLVHAFFCALATDTRIGGILMPAITLGVFTLQTMVFPRSRSWKSASAVICYVLFLILLIVLMWPMLWQSPWKHFITFFQNAAHFRFPYKIFYMGQWLAPGQGELPWHYLPMWIVSSVPVVILVLFFSGTMNFFYSLRKGIQEILQKPLVLIALLWFFIPVIFALITKPTMYDGWRHFYFVYPAMVILSIYGLFALSAHKKLLIVLISVFVLNMSATLFQMIRTHPYEHLYFNQIAGKDLESNLKKFQMDLWGVEFRKPLEYILHNDPAQSIKVFSSNVFTVVNLFLMPEKDKHRIQFVRDARMADYWILDYYFMDAYKDTVLQGTKLFMINIEGVNIVSVYRPKDQLN